MSQMFKLSLRGIRAHLGRLALTFVAISLGVGFVSGSFIIKDSLTEVFDGIVNASNADVDARVQAADVEFGEVGSDLPESLVAELEALPEVGFAEGSVGYAQVNAFVPLDEQGEQRIPNGPPILSFSWSGTRDGATEVFTMDEGTKPGPGQVAIDYRQAEVIGAGAGDVVIFNTPTGQQNFEVSGVIRFEGSAGAWFVLFDLPTAQALYDKVGLVDSISIGAATGTTEVELLEAIAPIIPDGAEALGNSAILEEDSADFTQIINIIGNLLLAFALVALFVSLFIIYNTFAILVSQRIQEIGMLRAIGATAGQVRASIVFEALVVGVLGSAAGILTGVGVAAAIKGLFQRVGGFPETGTVIGVRTIAVSLIVGIVATVISAIGPAFRASRISPIAAMRNEPPSEHSTRVRTAIGVVTTVLGLAALFLGLFGGFDTAPLLGLLGVGAIFTFVGVAMLSVLFAGPVANAVGRGPIMASLGLFGGLVLAVFGVGVTLGGIGGPSLLLIRDGISSSTLGAVAGGVALVLIGVTMVRSGIPAVARSVRLIIDLLRGGPEIKLVRLARQNAARSPQRTAATATALMIGLALVTTVSVLGQSLKSSFASTLDTAITADLFVFSSTQQPTPVELGEQLRDLDGIDQIARFRFDEIKVGDEIVDLSAYETATTDQIMNIDLTEGELRQLGAGEVYVFRDVAEASVPPLALGDTIDAQFSDGSEATLTIAGIYDDNSVIDASYLMDLDVFQQYYPDVEDVFVGATLEDGANAKTVKAEAKEIASAYPQIEVKDNQEFLEQAESQVNSMLALINGLLGLALIVAFFGIVNTIVLSVLERTREIGLMRAIGMTRDQLMTTIRLEALIVCLFGAVLGLVLGALFAWAAVSAIPDEVISSVSIPWLTMGIILMASSVLGVLAAFLPARRAAQLDVLEAIATV